MSYIFISGLYNKNTTSNSVESFKYTTGNCIDCKVDLETIINFINQNKEFF